MEMAKEQELILVLDFGSQYNQLITRRIREMGVCIVNCTTMKSALKKLNA